MQNSARPPDRDRTWRAGIDPGLAAILVCFAAYIVLFSALDMFAPHHHKIMGVDPVGYYAWFRSLFFDGDLDFENEYRALNPPGRQLIDLDAPRTATGRLQNPYSVGPAILWTPFLLLAHGIAGIIGAPQDGFSQPYFAAVYIANALYGLGGVLLTYYSLRAWFPRRPSAVAAIAAWSCSSALYYTFGKEVMSHACSFFCIALLVFLWARFRERRDYWVWALIGVAIGLASLVRWQDATFAAIPAIDLLWRSRRENIWRLVACGAAGAVLFIPQAMAWKIVYGAFLTIPQTGSYMSWTHPHPLQVLFSPAAGLLAWTPLIALALIGLHLWPKDRHRVFIPLIVALWLQFYVCSSAGAIGWSFGMRRMVNSVPLFAVGFALLLTRLGRSRPWFYAASIVFAVWNLLFVLQYDGLLDRVYVNRAVVALCEQHHLDWTTLPSLNRLPNGEPFDINAFYDAHRFPHDRPPTFQQFIPDKLLVLKAIFQRLFGGFLTRQGAYIPIEAEVPAEE